MKQGKKHKEGKEKEKRNDKEERKKGKTMRLRKKNDCKEEK